MLGTRGCSRARWRTPSPIARLHNEQGCTISVELALRDGAYCTIRVSDDGAGIAAADLAALEARLARSRTARSAAGSFNRDHGLGLVLVDRIARAHEGSLSSTARRAKASP
ncbi:MAG: ATP-binding protein [Eggerthella lenta]